MILPVLKTDTPMEAVTHTSPLASAAIQYAKANNSDKVPKAKRKAYTTLLKKKGVGKKVKVTK